VNVDPADARQLGSLLRRHRIELQHRLGQNFLVEVSLRDSIADAAGLDAGDEVLEVGAGVGTLTVALAARCKKVVAVELDGRLLPALREVLEGHHNVQVVQADILRFDIVSAFPNGGEVVAGNIPYNLTGELMRRLPRKLSLVVQKEVADRWTATTGASLATVAVQMFSEPRIVMSVPAESFTPVPKVDSALVVLDVRPEPAVDVDDADRFLRFVEAVFQFRRKQLGGTVGRITKTSGSESASALNALGIDPTRRPQTLSLGEWEIVFRAFNTRFDR